MSVYCRILLEKDGMLLTVDNMLYIVESSGGEEANTFFFGYYFFFFFLSGAGQHPVVKESHSPGWSLNPLIYYVAFGESRQLRHQLFLHWLSIS